MKIIIKTVVIVGVVGLAIGYISYFTFFKPPDLPEIPQFKVVAELAKTQYQVGEDIWIMPSLINTSEQPITIHSGDTLLFAKIYDINDKEVLYLPLLPPTLSLVSHILKPGIPYTEDYIFTLDQPGRYKIVVWAELSLNENFADPVRIYAKPIWIEVSD
nr:hypothetical protein [uncultured bacterium]